MPKCNFPTNKSYPVEHLVSKEVNLIVDGTEMTTVETSIVDYSTVKPLRVNQFPSLEEQLRAGVRPETVTTKLGAVDLEAQERLNEKSIDNNIGTLVESAEKKTEATTEPSNEPKTEPIKFD